jgi:hypothetical protein
MKINYSNKIHELIGVKVLGKEQEITSSGKHAGKSFYRLLITCETHPEVKKIRVLDDKIGTAGEVGAEEMLNDIQKSNYADKRYLFYCYKCGNKYDLAGWKQLESK